MKVKICIEFEGELEDNATQWLGYETDTSFAEHIEYVLADTLHETRISLGGDVGMVLDMGKCNIEFERKE